MRQRVREDAEMANVLLLVFTHPVEGREDEYLGWYREVHIPQVLEVPGFVRAQHFRLGDGLMSREVASLPQQYVAIYEVEEGRQEEADRVLYSISRTERAQALEAGREPLMPRSDALAQGVQPVWYFAVGDVHYPRTRSTPSTEEETHP
jgi:hypothetical protein